MGLGAEGRGAASLRGRRTASRDESGRLREHPGAQETPGRVDDAGGADDLAGSALPSSAASADANTFWSGRPVGSIKVNGPSSRCTPGGPTLMRTIPLLLVTLL